MQQKIWDCAEKACGALNEFITDFLTASEKLGSTELIALLDTLQKKYRQTLGSALGEKYDQAFNEAKVILYAPATELCDVNAGISLLNKILNRFNLLFSAKIKQVSENQKLDISPPVLVNSAQFCNVVSYKDKYYALPHKLGTIELETIKEKELRMLDGVFITNSLQQVISYAKAYKG